MKSKLTRNQQDVLSLLQDSEQPLSAQTIYANLRQQGSRIGLATVYRSLETLKQQAAIRALVLSNGETVYSKIPSDRHHLNCLRCGKSLPMDLCPVREFGEEIHKNYNFKIYYHTLEFFGMCEHCQDLVPPLDHNPLDHNHSDHEHHH
jgi:Fur family ferric uptake transcriptional regulator